jgi:gliding motility-associated-like protein
VNDAFLAKPVILPGEQYELKIFNRYGQAVYSSSNYQNDWKGLDDGGKLVPSGPYYYLLKDVKTGKEETGPVNVIYK